MNYVFINKISNKPIYVQLADSIRTAINNHQLNHKDQLPTEDELCKKYEISNIVVKQAYQVLAKEGMITRIQGKGTFVRAIPTLELDIHDFKQIESRFAQIGAVKKTNLMDIVKDHDLAFSALKMEEGEEAYRFLLTASIVTTPVFSTELIMPRKFFPNFESVFINPNISALTVAKSLYGINVKSSTHSFKLVNLLNSDAQQLQIETDQAAHVIDSVFYDDQKNPLFYVKNIYPCDYLSFNYKVIL
jgi:GntR family transcriptional regulator